MRTDTLIIGAGHAGLTLSYHLTALGHDHLLLDRGRVADRWRTQRWDSFTLLTPNWLTGLPGFAYRGDEPDGFMNRAEVVDHFERYARSFGPPILTGVAVHHVRPSETGWSVLSDAGPFDADNVVIATGHHAHPRIPQTPARDLSADIHQLHTAHYRTPAQLPDGGVLVVGAGPSGQQIAEELALAGRTVVLAAGRHRTLPRRYRGRDSYWWLHHMGAFERTIDSIADPTNVRAAPAFVITGGCHDLDLRRLASRGVVPTGRLAGLTASTAWFADDLAVTAAAADDNVVAFRTSVDDFVARTGMPTASAEDLPPPLGSWTTTAPRRLDLRRAGIRTVLWATGYRRDFSWLEAPVLDATGEPVQRRGVTAARGLYFLGLRWMYRRGSDTIHGVGKDAEHIARHIARRAAPLAVPA